MVDDQPLAAAARDVSHAAHEARAWVRDVSHTASRVASQSEYLIEVSRRVENNANKLGRAASRRMCIGVFGPSQAGKSYLVSRLATVPNDRLRADLGGEERDFLREINPPGGKESTGLVTRFSTVKKPTPDGYPVVLRLLTETDLVRVFANSFLSDFDPNTLDFNPPKEAETRALMAELEKAPKSTLPAEHLSEIALFDLAEYFRVNFPTRIEFLGSIGYWEFLIDKAPYLSLTDRARLYSILWGGIEQFSELYLSLANALETLHFAPDAFAAISALSPREKSIIDVDRIKLDLGTPEDERDLVSVCACLEDGRQEKVKLPRARLCALVAELCITMKNEAWDLFDHTDLLDFPGARSRGKLRNIDENASSEDDEASGPRDLFIRGKVALLFQRYSEERELTSMLLCMPGSNAEVKDLSSLVREWIYSTHGKTPDERSAQRNALFCVLTKSDADFNQKDGEDEASRRSMWSGRIFASLLELYQRDGWLDNWDGKPFRNTLWLRNPGILQKHLIEYELEEVDGEMKRKSPLIEIGHAEDIQSELPNLRSFFLNDKNVTQYFRDPEAAFDALLSLNDGGVDYLVRRVSEVCDPAVKRMQVEGRLLAQARDLTEAYKSFYDADDGESRDEKLKQAISITTNVGSRLQETQFRGFGHFLSQIQADDGVLREIYLGVASMDTEALESNEGEAGGDSAPTFDLFAMAKEKPSTKRTAAPVIDRTSVFVERAINDWIKRLRHFAEDDNHPARFGIDNQTIGLMAEEMIKAVHRCKLQEKICADIRKQGQLASGNWEALADMSSCIAANALNSIVNHLGYDQVDGDERPAVPPPPEKMVHRAFEPPQLFERLPDLGDARRPIEREFIIDWLSSYVQLTLDNIGHSEGRDISEEQNALLGSILREAAIEKRLAA
ncbi:MAG: virulence factor SrfC family protein [Pseudomonadota bacterium]